VCAVRHGVWLIKFGRVVGSPSDDAVGRVPQEL
jgi:hypothetical protein